MNTIYKSALLISVFTATCFVPTFALAANEIIGVNSAVKGDVTIQTGEQLAKQAVLTDPVLLGDVINSDKVGSLQVLLKDQTIFTVGPDCELTIDTFVYDPNKNTNSMKAVVSKGMFRFMSGNISKSGKDNITIDSPVASMGVRGTMVEGLVGVEAIAFARNSGVIGENAQVDEQNATLFVLRGPGRNHKTKNRKGEISVTSAGQTVIVKRSGMAVFVADKDTPPSEPFALQINDYGVFTQRLRTKPNLGETYKPFEIDGDLRRIPKRTSDPADPTRPDYFEPELDIDRPTELDGYNEYDDFDEYDDTFSGSPSSQCSPINPNFPNC